MKLPLFLIQRSILIDNNEVNSDYVQHTEFHLSNYHRCQKI